MQAKARAILVFVIYLIYHRCDSLYTTTSDVELALKRASKIIWRSPALYLCINPSTHRWTVNCFVLSCIKPALSRSITFCPTCLIRPFAQAGIYCDPYGISKRDRLLPMFILLLWNNHCLRPLSYPEIDEVTRLAPGLDPNTALYCKGWSESISSGSLIVTDKETY